jgi:O-antigen/teichoic acid export membrane protein
MKGLAWTYSVLVSGRNDKIMDKVRHYKLAVGSSMVSKLGTTILQLALPPLAAVALGVEGFALYVILIAASGWLAITSLGLGPVLSVQVACNDVDGTLQREQVIVASAFWTSLGISILTAVLAVVAVLTLPIHQIFGAAFELRSREVVGGLLVLIAVYVLQMNLSIFEAAQAGLQRQHTTNLVVAAGALVTLPAVFAVAHWMPTPVAMLTAGILPTLALRLGHSGWLMSRRVSLLPRWHNFDTSMVKLLLSSGAVYSLAGSAGNFISHALPTIQIGLVLDAEQTGAFASTMHLIILLSGVTAMLVAPAVPAFASSLAQRDQVWLRKAYHKLLFASLSFAVAAALTLALVGDWIFDAWLRGVVQPEWSLITCAGAYFVLSTWEVVHFSLLVAMRKAVIASLLVFARAVVGAVITQSLLPVGGGATPFVAMCIAILLVDSVPLYLLVRSRLRLDKS